MKAIKLYPHGGRQYVRYSDHEAEVARLRAMAQEQGVKDGNEITRLRAEVEENENAINVWRGRTQRAEAEVEAYRKDAERYRWLRDLPPDHPSEEIGNMPGDMWDEQIDTAMGASA